MTNKRYSAKQPFVCQHTHFIQTTQYKRLMPEFANALDDTNTYIYQYVIYENSVIIGALPMHSLYIYRSYYSQDKFRFTDQ